MVLCGGLFVTITAGFLFRRVGETRGFEAPPGLALLRAEDRPPAAWAASGLSSLREHLAVTGCLLVYDPRETFADEPCLGDWDLRDHERQLIEAELLKLARSVRSQSEECYFFHVLEDWPSATPMLYRRGDLTGFSDELRQPYPFAECHFIPPNVWRREQGAFLFAFEPCEFHEG